MKPRSISSRVAAVPACMKHMCMTFPEDLDSVVINHGFLAERGAPCGDFGSESSANQRGTRPECQHADLTSKTVMVADGEQRWRRQMLKTFKNGQQ